MTDREKLIELLLSGEKTVQCEHSPDVNCDGMKCAFCERVEIADHLIANGVTFATDTKVGDKWIPTAERLPEHGDVVLCHHKHFDCQVICQWDKRSDVWLDNAWTYGTGCITHWMPLPEPPKEE